MSDTYTSFMSAFGKEGSHVYNNPAKRDLEQSQSVPQEPSSHYACDNNNSYTAAHQPPDQAYRRGSATSTTSYSTEPSPTTTSSTFDSPLVADMMGSPSSSPESATSSLPPKAFQPTMRSTQTQTIESSLRDNADVARPSPPSQSTSDDPRKNVKGLRLDMALPSIAKSTSIDTHVFSAPLSPSYEPLKPGRRKPNNLTIRTPSFQQVSFNRPLADVPSTPSHNVGFGQPLVSPRMLALGSPGRGPPGGMHLTLPNIASHIKPATITSLADSSTAANLPTLREEEYQPPQSQEVKVQGYPDGPVLIYENGVYLYLEPTVEEASKFDVVINVAKEVKSPFTESSVGTGQDAADSTNMPEPRTAASEKSFTSAFEWPSPTTPTIATPRPQSAEAPSRPEYLHVPWDHNSEILDDLYPLCQLINERVSHGKKVLVHCQLGVSRSASLVIAYGLYMGCESDFHSMYMSVKKRSPWVGPNMSLIYQLTDFKLKYKQGLYKTDSKAADPSWWVDRSDASTKSGAPPLQPVQQNILDSHLDQQPAPAPATAMAAAAATTAPMPQLALRLDKDLPPVPGPVLNLPTSQSNANPTEHTPSVPPKDLGIPQPPYGASRISHGASRPLPLRQHSAVAAQLTIPPHRPGRLPGLPSTPSQPSSMMDLARGKDEPATPSLFSPRATEFVANPFGILGAGDLASTAPQRRRPPPGAFPGGAEWRNSIRQSLDLSQSFDQLLRYDPRSPHQPDEQKEILRNIEDVL